MASTAMLEGYEIVMVPSFFAYQPFSRFYGVAQPRQMGDGGLTPLGERAPPESLNPLNDVDGDGRLDRIVPTWLQVVIPVGLAGAQLIGLLTAPELSRKIGYQKSALIGVSMAFYFLILPLASSFLHGRGQASNLRNGLLAAGDILLGLPWGLFQAIIMPYVSDITPLKLNGPATALQSIFWLIGQVFACSALLAASKLGLPPSRITLADARRDRWAFRAPMAIQYAWLVPVGLLLGLAPESPYHLMRQGKDDEALATLRRLNRDPHYDAHARLESLRLQNDHDRAHSSDVGMRACFKNGNGRRTEVAIVACVTQQLVGVPLMCYAAKVLQKSAVPQERSLLVTTVMYLLSVVGGFASLIILRTMGRRTAWMIGLSFEVFCLCAIGACGFFMDCATCNVLALGWVVTGFIMSFAVAFHTAVSPITNAIVSEAATARLRGPTNSLARMTNTCMAMGNLGVTPKMLQEAPEGWGLGCKAAFIWAALSLGALVWAFLRLPETKDRTPAEIDVMFERRIPARLWATTVI
ncbi:General alpha-glucoside permease-like protein [Hapsidospora chrysogenum ATCC 11550]|uniref:General alpha-glucoside permease-like protein n=1 Tax=Hapsidospora chrysogenum (strain ATCC 11550 / CBS 779.69 / DSM 880 / IAM 14645 / JCM 23072 / IMI 49137) TaxID=857340 RepID=A0A086SXF0_HAPC1|nr:General alpha-glucoside permease-like protein [Hapsidospora chrysogenum ATCC 11550]